MFGKVTGLLISVMLMMTVASCGKSNETDDQDRLTQSFRDESPDLQQHIAEIVKEAGQSDYKAALNKLALLSATRKLTSKQKYAVDVLVRQLRYDMEEEIFSAQEPKGVMDE